MGTPLRTPSIFTVTGSDFDVEQGKVQNGLLPQVGDEGSLSFGNTDREARRQILRRRRAVVCEESGQVRPDQKKLRAPSVFTCPGGDSLCQRELFLDEGFILEGNDPTQRELRQLDTFTL